MKRRIAPALVAVSLAGCALEQEPGPCARHSVTQPQAAQPLHDSSTTVPTPHWEQEPTGDELSALYPAAARAKGVGGKVRMKCIARKDGRMANCAIIMETPPNFGFGAAALASVRYFKLAPTTSDGLSVEGGVVIIPINWVMSS